MILDPGYPKNRGVRQAMMLPPKGVDWKGMRLKAELEVRGKTYPCNGLVMKKSTMMDRLQFSLGYRVFS
jgi:hypothetical protein